MTETRLLPFPKTAILVLVLLLSFASYVYAQDPPAWQFKFGGKVTEFNDKKQKDIALEGAVVTLFKGAQQVQSQSTNNSGKFKFSLDPNNDYTLTVTKPGYITKRFSISTYNVPTERGEGAFAEFDVEIGLFKLFPGLDYSCLDKPIAKISYNPARDVDDFDYDKVYTASIQACIDNLKRLEAEARAKQKLYDVAIEKADKAFNASQWQAAKDAYNEALTYLPNEQYPKDQIIKCDEKLGANAANEKKYSDAIAEANRLFDAKDWAGAKAKYQEASGIKPAEQFPKDRIVLCDQNIAAAGKQKQYDDAIAAADAKFKSSDWAGAKAKYQEASGMKPAEQYPKDQIVKCDAEIAKAGLQKQYDDAIAAADAKFKAADFAGAKVDYQKASGLKPGEQYPKDQIVKCDAEIAKAGLQKQYDDAIAAADAKFKAADFAGAKVDYQKASGLKPAEQYPKDQITKCDAEIAKAGLNKQYNDAIAAADAKFKAADWAGAKSEYQKASALKSAEQYPKEQIVKCDAEIAKQGLEKQYTDVIAAADAKFKAADWAGAKAEYQKASALKSTEQYPKDQIVKCDAEIAKQGLEKQYTDAIASADRKFKASDWAGAKADYQKASVLKTVEQYPKDQIKICDDNIAKVGLDKQYNDIIAAADKLFAAKNWAGAKAEFQKASDLKSTEQYPKDRMKLCDDNLAKEDVDKQYAALIADADGKFKASDWSGAKGTYQQALDLKPTEKYPKDQMKLCDDKMALDVKNKEYNDLVGKADAKFKTSDWSGAKEIYQQASALKPAEKYPKDQIVLCDKNIAAQEKDKQYTDLIGQADVKFKVSDWSGAKAIYVQASALKTAETYPKDQIKICDENINKAGKDKQYSDLIASADAKFGTEDWSGAKALYQQASAVKSMEQYPKDQIVKCDEKLALAGTEKKYADLIKQADTKFSASDWTGAKALYQQASAVKTTEQYPKDQIAKCDENIAKSGTDKAYNGAITAADAKFKLKDWAGAKTKYEEALTIKAGEQYPTDQIKLCNDNIAAAADKKYNDAIAAADAKFDAADFTAAKAKYQEASAMKPSEQYPKDRIKLCDENIAKNGLDKTYNAAIAAADAKFKSSDWAGAKAKYQEASSLKSGEQYPKDQIALCDKNIASAEGLEANYARAIARGDSSFQVEDYETAKSAYESALALKPGQAYPKAQLDEIDKRLAAINAGNAKDAKYRATLATADSLFALKDYAAAQLKYQDASNQRPLEVYPKDKYGECQRLLGDQKADAARQKRYDDLIKKADAKFASSDWSGAKKLYQDALKEKPLEVYPKTRIAECDKKLNPVTKADTARTPEQIKEDYRNEIAKSYPQGLTTMEEKEGGNVTLKRIVVIGDKGYVYTKKSYSWGTFYFKDGVQISEGTFNYETSGGYIQQELSKVPK